METNLQKTSAYVREQLADINPYHDKSRAFIWSVGFLSSVIAAMILADSANLDRFRAAVRRKMQRGPAAKE